MATGTVAQTREATRTGGTTNQQQQIERDQCIEEPNPKRGQLDSI